MSERVFEIKSGKAIIIKSLIECIKPYIKETNMLINSEGIKISTMDSSKSSLTYIKLDAKKFESFYCETPKIIGINTDTFFKTIKSANRRDTITFYMDKNNEDKFGIELADLYVGKIKDYKMDILALEDKVYSVPKLKFDYVINMPSLQFQQIIKDINLLDGSIIEIKSIGKQLVFSCNDGVVSDFNTTISDIDENLNSDQKAILKQNGEDIRSVKFERSTKTIVQGRFKLNQLMNFIKASHLCENMNLLIKNDDPLILEYFIADIGILRFVLLPESD